MNLKYNLAKMVIGMGNVGAILYNSLFLSQKNSYRFWNIVVGILLIFMVIRSVAFMKGQESTWIFLVSAIALMPLNIKLTFIMINLYLVENYTFTKILFGIVVYLCFLSAEEILLGVIARIIWPQGNESFLYAKKKLEEENVLID